MSTYQQREDHTLQSDGTTAITTHVHHGLDCDSNLHVQDALKAGFLLAAIVICVAQSAVGPASNGSLVSNPMTPEPGARGPPPVDVSVTTSAQTIGPTGVTTGQEISTAEVRADVSGAPPVPESMLCLARHSLQVLALTFDFSVVFKPSPSLPRLHLCQSTLPDPFFRQYQ